MQGKHSGCMVLECVRGTVERIVCKSVRSRCKTVGMDGWIGVGDGNGFCAGGSLKLRKVPSGRWR
eukprot:122842-Chlamydomonas_euryale.AAC.1